MASSTKLVSGCEVVGDGDAEDWAEKKNYENFTFRQQNLNQQSKLVEEQSITVNEIWTVDGLDLYLTVLIICPAFLTFLYAKGRRVSAKGRDIHTNNVCLI